MIVRIISFLGIIVNVALVVYIRNYSVKINQPLAFILFICAMLVVKYIFNFKGKLSDDVGKRCKLKI